MKTAPRACPAFITSAIYSLMDSARIQRIITALEGLTRPGLPKKGVLDCIRVLDGEVAAANSGLSGDLDHYLRRRSYEKALVYLQGGKPGEGTCGRGT